MNNDLDFKKSIIRRLEEMGECRQILKRIMTNQIFEHLSKHDPFWIHEDETTSDRLDEIRGCLKCIESDLGEMFEIMEDYNER
jgi:hypothetical protein